MTGPNLAATGSIQACVLTSDVQIRDLSEHPRLKIVVDLLRDASSAPSIGRVQGLLTPDVADTPHRVLHLCFHPAACRGQLQDHPVHNVSDFQQHKAAGAREGLPPPSIPTLVDVLDSADSRGRICRRVHSRRHAQDSHRTPR